jgi:fermentation-respiration switch protein FrsA (DUF1100 family)
MARLSASRTVRWLAAASVVVLAVAVVDMRAALLNSLLYFPAARLDGTPRDAGLEYRDLEIATGDGQRLHGWWIPRRGGAPALGHVLHFHGNAGNISHRLDEAAVLSAAGLDVLLFDYRGYGRSTGSPGEGGTYQDARAAREALLRQPGVDPARILYLGESLGGAVAVELAGAAPPRGLVLRSTFTSVRDMARLHYPIVPAAVVVDAYPTLSRLRELRVPLLVIHGDRDDIVPLSHGEALLAAAREPKRLEIVRGAGHNDLLWVAGARYAAAIAEWVAGLP